MTVIAGAAKRFRSALDVRLDRWVAALGARRASCSNAALAFGRAARQIAGMRASLAALALALVLAGCGEAVKDDHFAADVNSGSHAAASPVVPGAVAIRIGELGPSFDACGGAATTRHLDAGEHLPVRAAPFDVSAETGRIAAGTRFFICSRSHDQRWLGIVYDPTGALSEACGVSRPVTSRRAYEGPCRSGWVASAFVKQIAG